MPPSSSTPASMAAPAAGARAVPTSRPRSSQPTAQDRRDCCCPAARPPAPAPGRVLGQGDGHAGRRTGHARLVRCRRSGAQLPRPASTLPRPATRHRETSSSAPATVRRSSRWPACRRRLRLDGVPISGTLSSALDERQHRHRACCAAQHRRQQAERPLTLSQRRTAPHRASLDADEISVAKLLAPLLDQRLAITGAAEAAISGRQSCGPTSRSARPPSMPSRAISGSTAGAWCLRTASCWKEAKLDIALDAGKIEIDDISGKGLGGQFKARLQIRQGAGRRRGARQPATSVPRSKPSPAATAAARQRPRERHAGVHRPRLEPACADVDPARAGQDRVRRGQARHLVAGCHTAGCRCRPQGRAGQAGRRRQARPGVRAVDRQSAAAAEGTLRWRSPTASCASNRSPSIRAKAAPRASPAWTQGA